MLFAVVAVCVTGYVSGLVVRGDPRVVHIPFGENGLEIEDDELVELFQTL